MKSNAIRTLILFVCFLAVALVITHKFFSLQISGNSYFTAKIKNQSEQKETVAAYRGEIFMKDKDGELVALVKNKELPFIFAVPKEIKDPEKTSAALAPILGLEEKTLYEKLAKQNDYYEIVKRALTDEEAARVKNMKLAGIYFDKDYGRFYPNKEIASQVAGFVSLKDGLLKGQSGLEKFYQSALAGTSGEEVISKDVFGTWVSIVEKKIWAESRDGEDIVLTIDPNIETRAEEELAGLIASKSATGGTIIIMDPRTGAVLAMASQPSFDPNTYGDVKDPSVFLNPATQLVYEPGSTFKPITFSIALEEGVVTPDTTYVDYGKVQVDDRVIKNFENRVYGKSTMTNVLESSINTGAVFAVQKLEKQIFYDYLQKFGFGKKTGVDFQEVAGNISNLKTMRNINYATASFGQGISVTPLELIVAFSSIADSGSMHTPYLVEKRITRDGKSIPHEPSETIKIFSEKTAHTLSKMLVSVVENGFGKKAGVKGYSIAGKTGTAQIPDYKNGGYTNDVIHNFIGFAPAADPKFSILIKIDNPKGEDPSSSTVATTFHNLAQFLFDYYEIPPDQS